MIGSALGLLIAIAALICAIVKKGGKRKDDDDDDDDEPRRPKRGYTPMYHEPYGRSPKGGYERY